MDGASFFRDLAVLMAIAGVVAVVFSRFKWPKLIGYIAAGVLMSKFTWGGSFLVDEDSIQTIGQLGVVFLMFSMGLDFSPSQMKRIRSVAMPTAILDTIVMTWLGYTLGRNVFGWGPVPSLFLGVAICDSATTMLAKVISEMKWNSRPFVKCTLGTSVCEDIICVGLIAIAGGVARGQGISLVSAATSLGGLFVFFLAVIVFGLVLIPRLLKSVSGRRDDEALLLAILGLCFFTAWFADYLHFSPALGAFLVGIIGASSEVRERLGDLVDPLKTMFASVFFVSVGLLVCPMEWMNHWPEILIVSSVVVLGKFVNCTVGAMLTGESVRTSVQMGMSMAQIGEFAFLVALIYRGATGDYQNPIFDIAVASSILTTLLNPFMIRWSAPVATWIERHVPKTSHARFETYRGFVAKFRAGSGEVELHRIVRGAFLQLGVIGVLIFAVSVGLGFLENYDWSDFSVFFNDHKRFVFCLLVNLFIVGMLAPILKVSRLLGKTLAHMLVGREQTKFHHVMRNIVMRFVMIGVVVLLYVEMSMINVNLAPDELWARWTIRIILLVVGVFGWRYFRKAAHRASERFNEAVGAEERRVKMDEMLTIKMPAHSVQRLVLDGDSPAVGATVISLNIRAKTGATVVAIERDGELLRNIGPDSAFCVGDTLVTVGEPNQLAALRELLGIR